MPKRTLDANYFADDKDIFDLLIAARQKLTSQKLVEFARRRGLFLSIEDERDELIEKISLLPMGWKDLNELIVATDTVDRTERVTSRQLFGVKEFQDIEAAVGLLVETRENRGEVYKPQKVGNHLRVTVCYSELDTSRTRLVQRTQREFVLEFEAQTTGTIVVRHQDQPRAEEVVAELVGLLASKPGEPIDESRIELTGVRDATMRTNFFLKLIRGIKGYKFEDVKAVKASRFRGLDADSSSYIDDECSLDDLEPLDGDTSDAIGPEEASFVTRVKEIALKGEGLLQSQQYGQLATDGFFVKSIVWTSTEDTDSGTRVEFESGFVLPEEAKGFTYSVRGMYYRKTDGEFRKSKVAADPGDRRRLLRLLEDAARKAKDEIVVSATTSEDPREDGDA